jgi:nickel-dependent lactate racemase
VAAQTANHCCEVLTTMKRALANAKCSPNCRDVSGIPSYVDMVGAYLI